MTKVFDTLLTKGYSRSQEYEADRMAIDVMQTAGYSPGAFVVVLSNVQSSQGDESNGWVFDSS